MKWGQGSGRCAGSHHNNWRQCVAGHLWSRTKRRNLGRHIHTSTCSNAISQLKRIAFSREWNVVCYNIGTRIRVIWWCSKLYSHWPLELPNISRIYKSSARLTNMNFCWVTCDGLLRREKVWKHETYCYWVMFLLENMKMYFVTERDKKGFRWQRAGISAKHVQTENRGLENGSFWSRKELENRKCSLWRNLGLWKCWVVER